MLTLIKRCGIAAMMFVGAALAVGCSSTKESANRDTVTADAGVGVYPPGPQGVYRPRVGVPPFNVQTGNGFTGGKDVNDLAADQMTTLLFKTDRFQVIERAQLQQLLKEQNLEGIVQSDELANQAKVHGVDYLLLGRVTNLRVKREQTHNEFGLAQLPFAGGADVQNSEVNIKTDCGVDIRLVDPTTGTIVMADSSEFTKTDSAKSMGLAILGNSAQSGADIQLTEDDKGKILRLALDDALHKSLPRLDAFLRNQPSKASADAVSDPAAPAPGTPATPAATPAPTPAPAAAAMKYCPNCGAPNSADAKFCIKCGHKLD